MSLSSNPRNYVLRIGTVGPFQLETHRLHPLQSLYLIQAKWCSFCVRSYVFVLGSFLFSPGALAVFA